MGMQAGLIVQTQYAQAPMVPQYAQAPMQQPQYAQQPGMYGQQAPVQGIVQPVAAYAPQDKGGF